jgi:transcriptional regulator with XRE-family HTH domain
MLTGEQVKAARALLDWSEERLAEEAHLAPDVIRHFEEGHPNGRSATSDVLRRTLEAAGAEFIAENGSVCVHFRADPTEEGIAPQLRKNPLDDGIMPAELTAENDD